MLPKNVPSMRTVPITWNDETICISFDYPPIPIRNFDWSARLENYDPTPWDSETPAHGPHATVGYGQYSMQAICDLVEKLVEL